MKWILFLILCLSIFHERDLFFVFTNEADDLERQLKIDEAQAFVNLWEAEVESDKLDITEAYAESEEAERAYKRILPLYFSGSIPDKEYHNYLLRTKISRANLQIAHVDLKKSQAMLEAKIVDRRLAEMGKPTYHFMQPRYGRVLRK